MAGAQPGVNVNVDVNLGADSYDTVAPGDPVESVDVFYDQLSPYGVWVDEPDAGRVFIPETTNYVPFTTGHWQYTNLGFVWISNEPFGWATAHYGRWAYSNHYGRWYWRPDTEWGPAWVEWRQTGTEFGWAPLAPEVVVRAGWQPPIDSWHYCRAEHVLDADVSRYYEPRTRVVAIHREARPIEHYSRISNVRVVVGPPAASLRERHVAVRPVRVEPRAIGRWSPSEAQAQVVHAREHQAVFEAQNQRRIESNPRVHAAHVKVLEAHPQIKAQVTARAQVGGGRPGEANRGEANRGEANRGEPARVAPNHPGGPTHTPPSPKPPEQRAPAPRPPERAERAPAPRPPERAAPSPAERAPAPRQPERAAPSPAERAPAPRQPERAAPSPAERAPAPRQPERAAPSPAERAPAPRPPERAAPSPAERAPAPRQPVERAQPPQRSERKEPERKDDRKKDDERH
jgi:hypothetical protein